MDDIHNGSDPGPTWAIAFLMSLGTGILAFVPKLWEILKSKRDQTQDFKAKDLELRSKGQILEQQNQEFLFSRYQEWQIKIESKLDKQGEAYLQCEKDKAGLIVSVANLERIVGELRREVVELRHLTPPLV